MSDHEQDEPLEQRQKPQQHGFFIRLAQSLVSFTISAFHSVKSSEGRYAPEEGERYACVRHSPGWVYYRGLETRVGVSVLGARNDEGERELEGRVITMQKRGWRTGLFGWTIGGWLGGSQGKDMVLDVTPVQKGEWLLDVDSKTRERLDGDVNRFLEGEGGTRRVPDEFGVLETDFIHVPVSSGDGYFRFVYRSSSKNTTLLTTPTFRIGSLSLSSAQPRGASVLTILPELLLRTLASTATAAAYASFFAAFPLLKVTEVVFGRSKWSKWAFRKIYEWVGGERVKEDVRRRVEEIGNLGERRRRVEESVYQNVPFASAGIRTEYDLEEDIKNGRAGICFKRS